MEQTETQEASPTAGAPPAPEADPQRLAGKIAELQRERDQLVAVVDILQEISASLHFVDILQTIARKLGEAFGLDRCSIFLAGDTADVRLVASYENPSIRNMVVDLERYPEIKRAFESGDTVFIADAASDPMFQGVRANLDARNVRSIIVVPIRWRQTVIGAIFLRTERDATPFSDSDLRFIQVIASLTAKALWNAHRFEMLLRSNDDRSDAQRRVEMQRVALIAFLRRLLDRYAGADEHPFADSLLPRASDAELDRLAGVVMQVLQEEAKA